MSEKILEKLEQRVLGAGYSFFVKVESASMEPFLKEGDEIEIRKVSIERLGVGDIILFSRGSLRIAHRIIQIYKNKKEYFFITKGDASSFIDDPICSRDVVGIVSAHKRSGKNEEKISRSTSWSFFGYWYAQYVLFRRMAANFVLRTQKFFFLKLVYFYFYWLIVGFVRCIFFLFCPDAKIYIKFSKNVDQLIPGASDMDLLVAFDSFGEDEKKVVLANSVRQEIAEVVPLMGGPKNIFDQIELENVISWGGCEWLSFSQNIPDLKKRFQNKLSLLATKISIFDHSFFLLKAIFFELGCGGFRESLSFSDPRALRIAKGLLKFICYSHVVDQDSYCMERMESLRINDVLKFNSDSILFTGIGAETIKAVELYFNNPRKRQNLYFKPQETISFCVELLNKAAFSTLDSFQAAFPVAHENIRSVLDFDKLPISDKFYNIENEKFMGIFKKINFIKNPSVWHYYIAEDNASPYAIFEGLSEVSRRCDELRASAVLKQSSLMCLALDLLFRPSWISARNAEQEKKEFQDLYKYALMRLEIFRYQINKLNLETVNTFILPNIKMLYLGIRHGIYVNEDEAIDKEFELVYADKLQDKEDIKHLIRKMHLFIYYENKDL